MGQIDRIRLNFRYGVSRKPIWEAITNTDEPEQWFFKFHNLNLERDCEIEFFEPGGFLQYTLTYPKFSRGVSVVTCKGCCRS